MGGPPSTPSRLSLTAVHLIQRHAPFDRMAREHLLFLATHLKLSYHTAGEVILSPEQGLVDRLFIIRQGEVTSDDTQAGRDFATVLQLVEGECFPLGALLSHRPVTTRYQAVGDVFLLELDAERFRELLALSPPFQEFCRHPFANLLELACRQGQASFFLSGHGRRPMHTSLQPLIAPPPPTCGLDTPVREAVAAMRQEAGECVVIVDDAGQVQGVFTLGDLAERVTLANRDPETPIREVMTRNPLALAPETPTTEAALAMAEHGLRRVLVTAQGRLLGEVVEGDVFPLARVSPSRLHQMIRIAHTPELLRQAREEIAALSRNLLTQGVGAELTSHIATTLTERLESRIIRLEHEAALARGEFSAELVFCWLTMGSEGRRELSLRGDQDNGLIFIPPPGTEPRQAGAALAAMAQRVNNLLDYCGIPLCQGMVMACNPKWRLSPPEWRGLFQRWIEHGDPDALLHAAILFDFRPLHGETELAVSLRQWLAETAVNKRFLHQMTLNALRNRPPLGVFRDFTVNSEGGIDLKLNGVMPFVDAARILALATRVRATGTSERLRQAAPALKLGESDVAAWVQAFQYLQGLRLRCQLERAEQGLPPSHLIDPDHLNPLDQRILKEVFRQARKLQSRLAMEFQR